MKKTYKYGVELECYLPDENYQQFCDAISNASLPFQVGSDGSISPSDPDMTGMEIRTTRGIGYESLSRSVSKLDKIMNKYDVRVNQSCGFHVHTSNKRFINATNLKRLTLLWVSIEDVLLATQPKSRYNNNYCKRKLLEYVKNLDQKIPRAKERLIRDMGSKERYHTLNYRSLYDHRTVECRMHAGTVDGKKIINWVRMLIAVYDYVFDRYSHEEVKALFNMSISDEKINKVFDMLELKPDLKTFYIDRIRRFGFDKLQKQQVAAQEIVKLQPKRAKMQTHLNKVRAVLQEVENEFSKQMRFISG